MIGFGINQIYLYQLQVAILFDALLSNDALSTTMSFYRMCRALMPGDDENLTDEAVWETLPVRYCSSVD